ncbi:hypothetical protein BH23PLA1_BH23PLA1_30580 [soil metagenome]
MSQGKRRTGAITLLALLVLVFGRPAKAEFLSPTVLASIDDFNFDGIGDAFHEIPGLLRHTTLAETRAIAEFELFSMRVEDLTLARLQLELTVNNPQGLQERSYDVFLYPGNGQADLFDAILAGPLIERITFTVPASPFTFLPIAFDLDILDPARSLLGGTAEVIGVRLQPIGANHFPTILTSLRLIAVPEPTGAVLLGLGLGLILIAGARRRS